MSNWFYLSFVDEDKDEFLGACYVEGETIDTAVRNAWDQGINPGGQVLGLGPWADQELLGNGVANDVRNKLLSKEFLVKEQKGRSLREHLEANAEKEKATKA